VFEYVGCGLPVLTLRHKALARLIEAHGLGVVLNGLDSLEEQLDALDLVALRRRVAAIRFDFTVESQIGRLLELYDSLI
jgi:glycosyltransferase involved in cell wall biosynthesis